MDLFDKLEGRPGPLGEFTSDGYGYYTFPKLEGPLGPEMKFNGKDVVVCKRLPECRQPSSYP